MDKVAAKIPEEILQKTTNCEFDFNCLLGDKQSLYEIKSSMGHGMLELKPKFDVHCKYRLSFGETYFCRCPTRNEI